MLKKGITMIALITTMIVMMTLISVVSISGYSMINNSKKVALATELVMVQEAVNNYYDKTNGTYPTNDSVILDIKNVSYTSRSQFDIEDVNDDKIILEKIDYSKLGIKVLKYGNLKEGNNDIYAVSPKTGVVYYAKGLSAKNYTYYTLTEDLKQVINYNIESSNSLNQDGIIFVPSTRKITNSPISLRIKIPNHFTGINVTSIFNYSVSEEGIYKVYTINNIDQNTEITVNYSINDKQFSAKFEIDNIDKEKPIVVVDENQEVYISEDVKKAYVNFEIKSDDIKVVKYEIDKIPEDKIVTYFLNNGIKLNKNSLPIESNVKYLTLYVEDNAGNFVAKYIEVKPEVYDRLN